MNEKVFKIMHTLKLVEILKENLDTYEIFSMNHFEDLDQLETTLLLRLGHESKEYFIDKLPSKS